MFVKSIGNLTLLTEELNQELSHKAFSDKRSLIEKHSRLSLNADVISQDNWDVVQIQERENTLIDHFLKILATFYSSVQIMILEKQQIVNELFRKAVIYKVPLYQRHYVWDDTNWEHLWNDITKMLDSRDENEVKEHFTGAIVIQQGDHNSPLEIIDGQQRLTTFQLILCAIRDICAANFTKDPNEVKSSCEKSMTLEPLESLHLVDEECKLLPREGQDQDIFLSLVKGEQNRLDKKSKIWKAYDYFKRKIIAYVKDDYSGLHRFYESITQDFIVVAINVTQEDDYAKVFKSINGTGRRLDQFDLLRNDLFLRAGTKKRDEWYNKYWEHFEDPDSDWRNPGSGRQFSGKLSQSKTWK